MSDISPRLGLPFIQAAQAQKHVTHNEAVSALDAAVQLTVLERDRNTPPADPGTGDTYALGSTPTDAWAGANGQLAVWDGFSWQFAAPSQGWRAWDIAAGSAIVFDGLAWQPESPVGTLQNLDGVGVRATYDATNRFVSSAPATLLNHDAGGGGHQLKINKADIADTASLLFQTGFSGRAEMGLAGNDGFSVKVSSDGAAWFTAFEAEPNSGRLYASSGLRLGGNDAAHDFDTYEEGTWTPTLGTSHAGDLAGVSGLSNVYAEFVRVGKMVTLSAGFDLQGVPASAFTQKSGLHLQGLPFEPADDGGSIDRGGVTGFVHRSLGAVENTALTGGLAAPNALYLFTIFTGQSEAHCDDRFHVSATYVAAT